MSYNFNGCVNLPEFLVQLYVKGQDHESAIEQWLRIQDFERALFYKTKLEGVVEILENYHVGDVGEGLNYKGKGVCHRFHTFDRLYKELAKAKPPSKERS